MRSSFAVAALLFAGQAVASHLVARQSLDQIAALIPESCNTQCAPITGVATRCTEGTDAEKQTCACGPETVAAFAPCTTCVVEAITESGTIEPAQIQAGIDAAQKAFQEQCAAVAGGAAAGGSQGGSSSTAPPASSSTTAGGAAASGASGAGNSGFKLEVGGSVVAVAAGVVGSLLL